jgi:hypothetical protein
LQLLPFSPSHLSLSLISPSLSSLSSLPLSHLSLFIAITQFLFLSLLSLFQLLTFSLIYLTLKVMPTSCLSMQRRQELVSCGRTHFRRRESNRILMASENKLSDKLSFEDSGNTCNYM